MYLIQIVQRTSISSIQRTCTLFNLFNERANYLIYSTNIFEYLFPHRSRQLLGIILLKLRLAHANNGPESSVATAMRFRCTTSRSNSFLLVNYHPTLSEETMLMGESEHTYRRLPSLQKEENNILVLRYLKLNFL